jgi:predicted phage baseplate assembly protein
VSLPAPNLDDRSFQSIVDDMKRQIGLRCPEWTDHNVSDPGVTLIELFAFMTEMTLYRMNQVPERNYIKFLEMLGVTLEPPAPARTDLRFFLSRAIQDAEGEEANECTLPARDTVAATVRTDTEEAIEFALDAELRMRRPRLRYCMALPAGSAEDADMQGARDFTFDQEPPPGRQREPFLIFSAVPVEDDALYLGFEEDVSQNIVEIEAQCLTSAPTALREAYPSQVWEYWNGDDNRWERLEVPEDGTHGFNRTGGVQIALPPGLVRHTLGGRSAIWVRCRYTTSERDLPPRGPENLRPAPYQNSPEILALSAQVIGGTAPASNSITVLYDELGISDGTPGQIFTLRSTQILPRRAGETILVGEQNAPISEMTRWTEVVDFSESKRDDRHFVCVSHSGQIVFGPNILQPDGSTRQHGAVPDKGLTIVFSAYRYGGGTQGNVKENQVRVLKSSIPYIAEVFNPRRAYGGLNGENLERAKLRGRALLRQRERAVTPEDFEFLAGRSTSGIISGVGRARCVRPNRIHSAGHGGQNIPPGVVRVLIVPALSDRVTVPRPRDLRVPARTLEEVYRNLDERRLLTTVLEVDEPDYVWISTDITLVADPRADADQVRARVEAQLNAYLHPLTGGPQGEGWPFRRALTLSDIYAQVGAVGGVAFLLDARIFVSRLVNREEGLLGQEERVTNEQGVDQSVHLKDNELICTREHRIRLRPMWAVGAGDGVADAG